MPAVDGRRCGLGIGVTYSGDLDPFVRENRDLVDFLELEPQTISLADPDGYRVDEPSLERIRSHDLPIVLHSVGCPVGGSIAPDPEQAALVRDLAERLRAPWVSEHLSFNRATHPDGEGTAFAGMMLPPRQTSAGVEAAAASIRAAARGFGRPLAVETGVNYLCPREDELGDGEFVAAVATAAGCGILLDVHNVWTNASNGRQPVQQFLAALPLEKVWELHVAGGTERQGYWLDSHAGPAPEAVTQIARDLIPELVGLQAVTFEILPAWLQRSNAEVITRQLEDLQRSWRERERRTSGSGYSPWARDPRPVEGGEVSPSRADPGSDVQRWERSLVALVTQAPSEEADPFGLAADPGIDLLAGLVKDSRVAMITQNLRLTCRLLLLTRGEPRLRALFDEHCCRWPPQAFAFQEADSFGAFLWSHLEELPYLSEVLAFERAVMATLVDEQPRTVAFEHDPMAVLRALGGGILPEDPPQGTYEVEITGEDPVASASRPIGMTDVATPTSAHMPH